MAIMGDDDYDNDDDDIYLKGIPILRYLCLLKIVSDPC